jgi:hypothetical protein
VVHREAPGQSAHHPGDRDVEVDMTARAVPDRARTLARELAGLFTRDRDLAIAQNDALQRLRDANDRLWSGLAPEGLGEIYGGHAEFEAVSLEAAFHARSEVLESGDPLAGVQEVHWEIHRAMIDHQNAAEDRRHLAGEIGEATARFVDALIDAGWTRQDAESANVDELAKRP